MRSPEFGSVPPSWEARERSTREAVPSLVKDVIKYSPGRYLQLLRRHPGLTLTITTGLIGLPLAIWEGNTANITFPALLIAPTVAVLGNKAQQAAREVGHWWTDYKRGFKRPVPDGGYPPYINLI